MDSKRKLLDYHTDEGAKRIVYLYFYLAVERGSWFLYGLQQHGHTGGLASDDFLRCIFPKYYDPDEEEYFGETGVLFEADEPAVLEASMVWLSNDEYLAELEKWSKKYREKNPKDSECVETLLADIRENFERWYCFERKQM